MEESGRFTSVSGRSTSAERMGNRFRLVVSTEMVSGQGGRSSARKRSRVVDIGSLWLSSTGERCGEG